MNELDSPFEPDRPTVRDIVKRNKDGVKLLFQNVDLLERRIETAEKRIEAIDDWFEGYDQRIKLEKVFRKRVIAALVAAGSVLGALGKMIFEYLKNKT